jgi:hypothetical protein
MNKFALAGCVLVCAGCVTPGSNRDAEPSREAQSPRTLDESRCLGSGGEAAVRLAGGCQPSREGEEE